MSRVSRSLFARACWLAALVCACSEDDDFGSRRPGPGSPSATGTLVFDWSIEGRKDAEACEEAGAVTFEAVVIDEGFLIGDVVVPCEDFEARVDLYVDDFLTRCSLLDERGVPALGRIIEDLFVIAEGKETRLVMDFPSAPVPMDPVPDAGAPPPADAGADTAPGAEDPPPAEPPPPGDPADAGAPDAGDAAAADSA